MCIFAPKKTIKFNITMKKVILFIAACLLMGKASAQTPDEETGYVKQSKELQPLQQSYLDNVYTANDWDSNWFVSLRGGVSAFIGKPVGHGDLFDRTKPLVNIAVGKWFTPHVGGRLAFQGMKFIDSDIVGRKYQNVHADFMYNVTSHFRNNFDVLPKWDIIPYVGCGVINNSNARQKPFAISYGVIGRYRIATRLHASCEIGATTTFQNFDGYGSANKLGDHLLQASIGLEMTIGKVGWKKVADPKPYIVQNDILMEYLKKMEEENELLVKKQNKDDYELKEMRKILEIEGLLEKYNLTMADDEEVKAQPRNNYSGLNSLRARLRNKGWNGDKDNYKPMLASNDNAKVNDDADMSPEKYFKVMKDGKIFVGSPIFFFFKIGTDKLTEEAQIINIKEVANCIKKYGLNARIVGAADSQTGSAFTNEKLSSKRADFIAALMRKEGVPDDKIQTQYRGGINSYAPLTGNRNTCVMLYFK